jgi:hypothetical protein
MDHEKPEALYPQVYEYNGTSIPSNPPTPEPLRPLSIEEPDQFENRKERRGENVW